MGSNSIQNLNFSTLNSNGFVTFQQLANITLNCTGGTLAAATLVSTQSRVSGRPGVSATTLAGLSMAATWVDDNSAVTFNSPRAQPDYGCQCDPSKFPALHEYKYFTNWKFRQPIHPQHQPSLINHRSRL